ncbi:MAG: metallophosphoesterase [Henriciella sp.]|uniref:metallophosphoesterase n=1 Tax=Henriciella sp. TaxID=1968823 RepID=UPI003C718CE7
MASETVIYAIGDVHGEADKLADLHAAIFARHAQDHEGTPLKLIHVGDYIDRGPDSFAVIDTLMRLEERDDIETINLLGNHEQMMLDAYEEDGTDARLHWLMNGGDATLESYGRRGHEDLPDPHLSWVKNLPTLHLEEDRRLAFVHAGVDPATFPHCDRRIHLWTRSQRFFNPARWDVGALKGWKVIHGHTPTHNFQPQTAGTPPRRFNLDTGAVYGGVLTAGVFTPDGEVDYISV